MLHRLTAGTVLPEENSHLQFNIHCFTCHLAVTSISDPFCHLERWQVRTVYKDALEEECDSTVNRRRFADAYPIWCKFTPSMRSVSRSMPLIVGQKIGSWNNNNNRNRGVAEIQQDASETPIEKIEWKWAETDDHYLNGDKSRQQCSNTSLTGVIQPPCVSRGSAPVLWSLH